MAGERTQTYSLTYFKPSKVSSKRIPWRDCNGGGGIGLVSRGESRIFFLAGHLLVCRNRSDPVMTPSLRTMKEYLINLTSSSGVWAGHEDLDWTLLWIFKNSWLLLPMEQNKERGEWWVYFQGWLGQECLNSIGLCSLICTHVFILQKSGPGYLSSRLSILVERIEV